ncbi:hypothetical protein X975_25054, partial [Stegodyphus mimosarum]
MGKVVKVMIVIFCAVVAIFVSCIVILCKISFFSFLVVILLHISLPM